MKLIFSKQTSFALNNSNEFGSTWYELATKMEQLTKKIVTAQYVCQLIWEIQAKIKKAYQGSPNKIIEVKNHRYVLNERIVLKMHKNAEVTKK